MAMLNGESLSADVLLPDEVSVLVLRAYSWLVRGQRRDAVDLWRALEIASASGTGLAGLDHVDAISAAEIAREAFLDPGTAVDALGRALGLSRVELRRRSTRLRALVLAATGDPDRR
jgi:hypothetical protein